MYVETYLPTCKPSTAANYPYTIERWLRPRLGGVPISEVDYDKVLAIQNAVRANGNTEASVRSTGTVPGRILSPAHPSHEWGYARKRAAPPHSPPSWWDQTPNVSRSAHVRW